MTFGGDKRGRKKAYSRREEYVAGHGDFVIGIADYNVVHDLEKAVNSRHLVAEIDSEKLEEFDMNRFWDSSSDHAVCGCCTPVCWLIDDLTTNVRRFRSYEGITLVADREPTSEEIIGLRYNIEAHLSHQKRSRMGHMLYPYRKLKGLPIRVITKKDCESIGYKPS